MKKHLLFGGVIINELIRLEKEDMMNKGSSTNRIIRKEVNKFYE